MFLILLVLLIAVPIAELYVIVQVAQELGVLNTIALLIIVSAIGAWLVKREGLQILLRVQNELARGRVPTKPLVDGALLLFAGALMLTPGFLSDIVGILLILPPTRAVVRNLAIRSFRGRIMSGRGVHFGRGRAWARVVNVEVRDDDRPPPPRPPRGELD
ncbi:MAG TPA: FxsA family protein [Acidimicrobiales bacterium]